MTNDKDLEFLFDETVETVRETAGENGEKRHRRKKRRFGRALLVLLGCLLLVLAGMWLGARIYQELDTAKGQEGDALPAVAGAAQPQIPMEPVYTQQELDDTVAGAVAQASQTAAAQKEEEILGYLQSSLSEGTSTVVALRSLYPDELVLVSGGTFHFVPIREDLAHNDYLQENLRVLENGEYQYVEEEQVVSHKGIDVSKYQGKIDWAKVAQDGVEFAFIRVGLRGYETGEIVEDERFQENIEGAKAAGIKVGVYFFSQAVDQEEALEEANFVLEMIEPYEIDCPVVLDVEKVSKSSARMNGISAQQRTANAALFCQTIEAAGYRPMIYHNMEAGALLMDLGQLEDYGKWFAYYQDAFYYPYSYLVWQYSSQGRINGISGDVDMNISFGPLWE